MAAQHPSPALRASASPRPHPTARPGYGKRSAPDQRPPGPADFMLLPARERQIAGFVDRLPDGAAMDIKSLAKILPLYGQMAVGSALRALGVAGHLRYVRCRVSDSGQGRWVTYTFWSRTARDNEWWGTFLSAQAAAAAPLAEVVPASPLAAGPPVVVPQQRVPETTAEPTTETMAETAAEPEAIAARGPVPIPGPAAAETPETPETPDALVGLPGHLPRLPGLPGLPGPAAPSPAALSPAYLALARLGGVEPRLALSEADCLALEALAASWLARGVDAAYLTHALVSGLPQRIGSPAGFVRRRLHDKLPPRLPSAPAPTEAASAPGPRLMVECTECRSPGPSAALVDGLCRPCRAPSPASTAVVDPPPLTRDVQAHVKHLRELLKAP
ncbi:MarR family transcriptional regulator [Streptomyces sp. NPDC005803]|uniref:MarR family transcriptional regulator n=1 Tax=Streptomyces sp. NPDC005803 TaxID=3154297 RepID=UPI0033EF160C